MQWTKIRAGHYEARKDGIRYSVVKMQGGVGSMKSGACQDGHGWGTSWLISRYDSAGIPRPFAGSSAPTLAQAKRQVERA